MRRTLSAATTSLPRVLLHLSVNCLLFASAFVNVVPRNIKTFPAAASSCSSSSSSSTLLSSSSSRPAIEWIVDQPLDTLLPKDDAMTILDELLSSNGDDNGDEKSVIDETEKIVIQNWDKLERKLRQETRSVGTILGQETTQSVIRGVRDFDAAYDPDAVRTFLGSNAVNDLFAKVLYDGIYQFFQTIDVFGNIISKLPIIGPMRNKLRDDTKRQLDRTVGPLIQSFLREYTKVAVGEAADFALSPANRKAFGSANAKLVASLLDRPVQSFVPTGDSDMTVQLREEVFDYVRKIEGAEELEDYVTFVYDLVGDKRVGDGVNVDLVLSASPTLQRTLDTMWEKAVEAKEEGA